MTSVTAGRAPAGFTLRLPEPWFEIDIWRATRTGDLARQFDARATGVPELRPWRGRLLALLRAVAADAERHGAVFLAALVEPVPDAGVLIASALAVQTDGSPDPDENTVAAIAAQITAIQPTNGRSGGTTGAAPTGGGTTGGGTTGRPSAGPSSGSSGGSAGGGPQWRQVEVIELPAGRAGRVRGVEQATGDAAPGRAGTAGMPAVVMHTLIPLPTGGGVLDVVFTSPQVRLADPLLELFGAISETLDWLPPPPPPAPAPGT